MNNSYTQVNVSQLRELITSMSNTQKSCSSALNVFTSAMQSLITSGQIEGIALSAFEENVQKIRSLEADFEAYCTEVAQNLNNIIAKEQDIEANFNQQYESLLSVNPEDFSG